jgi:HPr kinase/phosphorylase
MLMGGQAGPGTAARADGLVDESRVYFRIPGTTRDEVLHEMAERLVALHLIPDASDLVARLLDRERLGCTGLGGGIAIPHCKLSGISDVVVAGRDDRRADPLRRGRRHPGPVDLPRGVSGRRRRRAPPGAGANLAHPANARRDRRPRRGVVGIEGPRDRPRGGEPGDRVSGPGPRAASKTPHLTAEVLRSPALEDLELRVVAGESGFSRPIAWGRIQRPGLALAGFLPYIKPGRIQILGESELNYLDTMPEEVRRERIESICALPVAAFVITKGQLPPEDIVRECRLRKIPLLVSDKTTSVVIQSITRVLEDELAPSTTLHGVSVGRLRNGRAAPGRVRHRERASARWTSSTAATGWSPTTRSRSARIRAGRSSAAPPEMIRYHMELARASASSTSSTCFASRPCGRAKSVELVIELRAVGPDQEVRSARPGRRVLHDPRAGAAAAAAAGRRPGRNPRAARSRSPRATSS